MLPEQKSESAESAIRQIEQIEQKLAHTCIHFNGYQNTFCNASKSYNSFGNFMNRPCLSGMKGHCNSAFFPWPENARSRAEEIAQEIQAAESTLQSKNWTADAVNVIVDGDTILHWQKDF